MRHDSSLKGTSREATRRWEDASSTRTCGVDAGSVRASGARDDGDAAVHSGHVARRPRKRGIRGRPRARVQGPEAAIRVAADTLSASSAGDPRTERTARVRRDSSVRLDALVTQFLKVAQAEAGMTGELREMLDVGALSRVVAEWLRADGPFEELR